MATPGADVERAVLAAALAVERAVDGATTGPVWEQAFEEFEAVRDAYAARIREGRTPADLARAVLWWTAAMAMAGDDDAAFDRANDALWPAIARYSAALTPKRVSYPAPRRDALARLASVPSESLRGWTARYAVAKSVRLCVDCEKEPPVEGKNRCAGCLAMRLSSTMRKAERRRVAGQCAQCGKPGSATWRCDECRARRRARTR
ncbi:MAG: hypothetical protein Q8S13_06100 [Dehalococcoidia bacterium]|nr:hypothetical protein [Dehalococcoidia bacterium]